MTSIQLAIDRDMEATFVSTLLHGGADPYSKTPEGFDSFQLALLFGSLQILNTLLDHSRQYPQLGHWSCEVSGSTEVDTERNALQLLVEAAQKANMLDATDNNGHTLLFHASKNGDMSLVEELCKQGAKVHISDLFGWEPLHAAVMEGNISVTKLLLSHSASIKRVKSKRPFTPKDKINSLEHPSLTLLQIAILHNRGKALPEIVEALLEAGADPNERIQSVSSWDNRHDSCELVTPVQALVGDLKYRAGPNFCKTLQVFVERGADVSGVVDGMSVEDVTKFEGFEDLWETLKSSNKPVVH